MRRPTLVTRIGRADHGGNVYFGARVEDELLGRETTTSLLVLAVTGRRATAAQVAALDEVATVLASADPRIWLFKATRLGAAYGGMVAGVVAGSLCLHRASVGHLTASDAAALLVELDARRDDLRAAVRARIDAGRLVGFGVPFRARDERAVALERRLDESGRSALPFYALLRSVAAIVREERGLEPNLGATLAASFLDLGLAPRAVGPLVYALGQHTFLANAVEGAQQAPALLQRLPAEHVEYAGAPPRTSPRARGVAEVIASTAMSPAASPRILILDDDAMIRRAFERIAEDRGDVAVETATTPGEVLERVAARAFDLIVCDYRISVDGRRETSAPLVARLRALGLPVAVVTGSIQLVHDDLGDVPMLEKPIRLDDLIALARGRTAT